MLKNLRMSKKSSKFARYFVSTLRALVITIGLLLLAVGLLSVGVILRKDHSFRSQHIHQNERMKRDKIHCATSLDKEAESKAKRKINVKQL